MYAHTLHNLVSMGSIKSTSHQWMVVIGSLKNGVFSVNSSTGSGLTIHLLLHGLFLKFFLKEHFHFLKN